MASFQSFHITLMRYLCLFVLGSHQKWTKTAAEQQITHRSDLFMHLFTYLFWLAPSVLLTCLDIIRVCLTAEAVFIDKHSNLQCYKGRDVDTQGHVYEVLCLLCADIWGHLAINLSLLLRPDVWVLFIQKRQKKNKKLFLKQEAVLEFYLCMWDIFAFHWIWRK